MLYLRSLSRHIDRDDTKDERQTHAKHLRQNSRFSFQSRNLVLTGDAANDVRQDSRFVRVIGVHEILAQTIYAWLLVPIFHMQTSHQQEARTLVASSHYLAIDELLFCCPLPGQFP